MFSVALRLAFQKAQPGGIMGNPTPAPSHPNVGLQQGSLLPGLAGGGIGLGAIIHGPFLPQSTGAAALLSCASCLCPSQKQSSP